MLYTHKIISKTYFLLRTSKKQILWIKKIKWIHFWLHNLYMSFWDCLLEVCNHNKNIQPAKWKIERSKHVCLLFAQLNKRLGTLNVWNSWHLLIIVTSVLLVVLVCGLYLMHNSISTGGFNRFVGLATVQEVNAYVYSK